MTAQKQNNIVTDSIKCVSIPINVIRKANVIMSERNYLKQIVDKQNDIIGSYKEYKTEQRNIIDTINIRLHNCNNLNEQLYKDLYKEKRKYKFWKTTTLISCSIIGSIIINNNIK